MSSNVAWPLLKFGWPVKKRNDNGISVFLHFDMTDEFCENDSRLPDLERVCLRCVWKARSVEVRPIIPD